MKYCGNCQHPFMCELRHADCVLLILTSFQTLIVNVHKTVFRTVKVSDISFLIEAYALNHCLTYHSYRVANVVDAMVLHDCNPLLRLIESYLEVTLHANSIYISKINCILLA